MRGSVLYMGFFFLLGCTQPEEKNYLKDHEIDFPPPHVFVDTTDGEPFIAVIQEADTSFMPSDEELSLTDNFLKDKVSQYNQEEKIGRRIDLRYYKRQYFPHLNSKGDKMIEVNGFCEVFKGDKNWMKWRVNVSDGGKCYFHLIVNLSKQKVEYFGTNGEA